MHLSDTVFHLLRRILQEHGARWQARLPELTKPQYAVLRVIDHQPGIEQVALGHSAAIDKATLASLLTRMEQRGFIERVVDSGDRRRRLVHLTDRGRTELARARPIADDVDQSMLERLDEPQRKQLNQLLMTLTTAQTPDSTSPARAPETEEGVDGSDRERLLGEPEQRDGLPRNSHFE